MPSTYTSNLKLTLPATGENDGTWGNLVNTGITALLDQSVAGTASLTAMTNADYTLTTGNGSAANEARYMALLVPSTLTLTAARNIIVPTSSKSYIVRNLSTGGFAVTVKTSGGAGISVPNGKTMILYCNGTDVIDGTTHFTAITLGAALPVLSGGTGVTTSTGTGAVVLSTSPTLVTPALGTPTALVGTNITGTAAGLTAGTVTTNANLTGAITSTGNATLLGSFSSANLATALTDETGSGSAVFATSPTFVTPILGTPTSATLTNATGLPISTGVTGLGTGVATALAVNIGAAGAPVVFNGALGTPSSGTVTNLTGTASININGTVGATTAAAGSFTTLSASSTVSGTGFSTYLASPPAIGGTAANSGIFSRLSASGSGTYIFTNTAVGGAALDSTTTGGFNTAFGFDSLEANTIGSNNIAIGNGALRNNTGGNFNSAAGQDALRNNLTGLSNTAFGRNALRLNTGGYNTAVGSEALSANTTGAGNVMVGGLNNAGTYAPVFDPTTQNNRLCMGSTSVTDAYVQVAWTVVSDARDKTDFAPVPHGLDFVCKLKPTAYRYKATREDSEGHGPLRYGFKAQDVLVEEGANPVIVDNEDPEKLRFNDQSMIAVLVNAIKELKAEFDAYKVAHP
jgi:hypothetical protein